jgi:hypothetical protein
MRVAKAIVLTDEQRANLDLHLIVDNYATHKHPKAGRRD